MSELQFVNKKERLRRRNARERQLILDWDMLSKGTLFCEVCKGEKQIRHVKWYFSDNQITAEITFICMKTNCEYSAGRPYEETYNLSKTDEPDLIPMRVEQKMQATNPQTEFYTALQNTKGIGEKTISKLIQNGINTKDTLNNVKDDTLEQLGLTSPMILALRGTFKKE